MRTSNPDGARRHALVAAGVALAGLSTTACKADSGTDAPKPPSMEAAREAFEAPDGQLTRESAPVLIRAVIDQAVVLRDAFYLATTLPSLVENLSGEGEGSSKDGLTVERDPLKATFNGWGRLTWICTGWDGADAPVDDRWGRLRLNATFAKGGLGDVVWGAAQACQLIGGDGLARDYDLDLSMEAPDLDFSKALIRLQGEVLERGGEARDLDLDLRLAAETVELRVTTEGGDFVVGLARTLVANELGANTPLVVRDRTGEWRCLLGTSALTGACSHDDIEVKW